MIMGRKRKFERQERKFLKKAGFGREFRDMGALACALNEVQCGERPAGYVERADASHGKRTRQRVRRKRVRALVGWFVRKVLPLLVMVVLSMLLGAVLASIPK